MKREEFLLLEEAKRGSRKVPPCIVRQDSRLQHAISGLSSSSGSSGLGSGSSNVGSSGEERDLYANKNNNKKKAKTMIGPNHQGAMLVASKDTTSASTSSSDNNKNGVAGGPAKVSSSSGSSHESSRGSNANKAAAAAADADADATTEDDACNYHDYHAKPLPDPKLADSERGSSSAEDSPEESTNESSGSNTSNNGHSSHGHAHGSHGRPSSSSSHNGMKRVSSDGSTSSGDEDSNAAIASSKPHASRPHKRRKTNNDEGNSNNKNVPMNDGTSSSHSSHKKPPSSSSSKGIHPPKIAKKGGIAHNIRAIHSTDLRADSCVNDRLSPFTGIGKRGVGGVVSNNQVVVGAARVSDSVMLGVDKSAGAASAAVLSGKDVVDCTGFSPDTADTSSNTSSGGACVATKHGCSPPPQIKASFHVNEDDMILMENILMCPFTFRSQDAVLCGALAECVMPGMLRANFSERNKLTSLELVYDAMGFMQQLERASGNEGSAQIVPGSLELALAPTSADARVITTARPPYLIVNVNEVWTHLTGYTQMEVEGREYCSLLDGEGTVPQAYERPGRPRYDLEEIASGRPACMTNIHYDKHGNDFIVFVCSYPLTK